MSDLTAARERHKPGAVINRIGPDFGKHQCDYCVRKYPCDASLFRDALDEARAERNQYHTMMDVTMAAAKTAIDESHRLVVERDAARALADELGKASWGHSWRDMWHTGVVRPDECKVCAALAKREASHGHQHSFVWPSDAPGCPPRPCACGVEWEASQK